MRYVLSPSERTPGRPEVAIRRVIDPVLAPVRSGDPPRWSEAQGLGGYSVCLIHNDADLALVSGLPGVLVMPDLPIISGRLGDTTGSDRQEIIDAMTAQGFGAVEMRQRLGDDSRLWSFRQALSFMVSRRRKPRHDEDGNVFHDGELCWTGPLPLPPMAGGAFPTTGILDTFTGSDGTSPPNANWTEDSFIATGGLQIQSNAVCADVGGGTSSGAYWNVQDFGPDCEAYFDITTFQSAIYYGVGLRTVQIGSAAWDGYSLMYDPPGGVTFTEIVTNDVFNGLPGGSSDPQDYAVGDSFGVSIVGTLITLWRKPSGGSWGVVTTRTDGTITTAGKIVLRAPGTTSRSDNFGGGTVIPAPITPYYGAFPKFKLRR